MGLVKGITTITLGSLAIENITRCEIDADNNGSPVHVDSDSYPSGVNQGIKMRKVTLTGMDISSLVAVITHAQNDGTKTLTVVLVGFDGGSNVTVALTNCRAVNLKLNSSNPGEPASASLDFIAKSADGTTDPLTIT